MASRDHIEESLHCLIVNVLVDAYERQGYEVKADHVGSLRAVPKSTGSHVPDIVATRGSEVYIIEVETQSTIDDPETQQQLKEFADAAPTRVYLAVPFECLEAARKLRHDLDIDFDILPCYPFVRYVGVPR